MVRGTIGLVAGVLILGVPACAGEFDGRWAADAQACAGETVLVVNMLSLRWREAACAVRTSYLVKDTWHIGARCWAGGATGNVAINLQLRGERLVLDWAGAPGEELRRCP
jgi:hypothetical protein